MPSLQSLGFGAGHVVFHGPREEVLPFFSGLGFRLPERKGIADFLQEVTSKKDQRVSTGLPSHLILKNSHNPSHGPDISHCRGCSTVERDWGARV